MMKKYITPTVEWIAFEEEDVVRTSTHDDMATFDTIIDWSISNGEFM